MAAQIKKLKNGTTTIYPITDTKAVFHGQNKLNAIIDGLTTHSSSAKQIGTWTGNKKLYRLYIEEYGHYGSIYSQYGSRYLDFTLSSNGSYKIPFEEDTNVNGWIIWLNDLFQNLQILNTSNQNSINWSSDFIIVNSHLYVILGDEYTDGTYLFSLGGSGSFPQFLTNDSNFGSHLQNTYGTLIGFIDFATSEKYIQT